ncbi:hypothetical protein [Streptomyces sp. NPDC054887]
MTMSPSELTELAKLTTYDAEALAALQRAEEARQGAEEAEWRRMAAQAAQR